MSDRSVSYRPEIDGLRAIAILLVIVFHSGFGWIDGGFIGVDVFFVISGYLIGGLLLSEHTRSGRLSLREFWGRRARRLLPLSSLVIATTVIFGMIVSVPVARQQISTDATSAALYVSNWTFARQAVAYSDRTVNDGLFTQFWSLSIEEQFYLLLPLIFLAVIWWSRRKPEQFARRLFGVISLLVVVSFASSIWATDARGAASYFLTYTRLWELGVGVAVAIWFQRRPINLTKRTDLIALAGLALILGSALTFNESMAYPGWRAAAPVIGTVLVLVFAARPTSPIHKILSLPALVIIGIWSYGWYLWHWPTIAISVLAAQRWFPTYNNDLLIVTAILVSLLLAAVTHTLIENPVRFLPALTKFPNRSLALGITLTAIAALIGPTTLTRIDNGNQPLVATTSNSTAAETLFATTPANAMKDSPRVGGANRCFEDRLGTAVEQNCVFGDPKGSVTIGLIGDSHAFQWLPALHQAGLENHWRVVVHAKANCPATPVRLSVTDDVSASAPQSRPYPECEVWRDEMLSGLVDEGPFDAIITSGFYNNLKRVLNDDGSRSSVAIASSTWSEKSRELFERLLAISPVVIRLEDTPYASRNVPECLSENPSALESCAIDVADGARRDASTIAIERAIAPRGVVFVDPTAWICPTDPCPIIDRRGVIKYVDANHLTQTYSFSLADDVAAMIKSAPRTTKTN